MEPSENRIAQARFKKNLKQTELADLLAISRGQLANLESGTRKVDLPQLREIATALDCTVAELLLPSDVPNQPSPHEAAFLAELRQEPGYDARFVLAAVRGVLQACAGVIAAAETPRSLAGDPRLVRRFTDTWNGLDESGRAQAVELLETARRFSS